MSKRRPEELVLVESDRLTDEGFISEHTWVPQSELDALANQIESEAKIYGRHKSRARWLLHSGGG